MTEIKPDTLFATPLDKITDFAFDEAVARVFPDMIRRSVPGYTTIIPMIGIITAQYAQNGTACYDLGCSLGASTLAMRHGLKDKQCSLIAIDNAEAMLERCSHYIELDNETTPVELICADINELAFQPCSVITLNFTLQFIAPEKRLALLTRLYKALKPGGVLILSEKICFPSPTEQSSLETLHWDFKRANGYSDLEVSQKRSALEQVLLPDTLDCHKARLRDAGFQEVFLWYQCFNFISLIALKTE
jgi:tRNA (cmo5U34)-methyltransferase